MEIENKAVKTSPHRHVFRILRSVLGTLALVFLIVFAIRVLTYYRLIQKGELLELPQFRSKITFGKFAPPRDANRQANLETSDDPALGAAEPLITVVEFADFECPFSRESFPVFREMAAKYGNRVRFILRDFPLDDIHPHARRAALAVNCAGNQGKYWQMHDKVFQGADALGDADLIRYAGEAGLNVPLFSACFLSAAGSAEIDADLADGAAAGVRGTPTFFFNGKKVEGAVPRAIFDKLLSASLSKN